MVPNNTSWIPSVTMWVGAGLWFVGTLVYWWKNRGKKQPENWIEAHKAKTGGLPSLPDNLVLLFENYSPGQPISKAMKPKTPSGQHWNKLSSKEQKQWRQVIEWLGEDPEDYLEDMRKMFPRKSPKGPGRWTPFKQG
jgi:hypothetical protein